MCLLEVIYRKENTFINQNNYRFVRLLKMKKTNWYNIINRNNEAIFNDTNHTSRSTMIGPELFIDRLWLNDEDMTGGVQIIELKSSDGSDASQDKDKDDQDNAQTNNYDQFQINDPRSVNTSNAREKRRLKNQSPQNPNQFEEKNVNYNVFDSTYSNDSFYKEFYASGNNNKDENVVINHQMNCFTILDKHYAVISDNSSEEDFGNIEVIDCDNLPPEYILNSCTREADRVPYDVEADIEKRMVWIYSFKNKRLLSDNDFELVNIPSQDLTTEASIENVPELNNLDNNCRVPTPIPSTFVPRLNLTMTSSLPTVEEVIEPSEQKLSPEATKEIPNDEVKRKPVNNWFSSENATSTSKEENYTGIEKSSNVVDWMVLSPREKRRRLISSSCSDSLCKYQFPISCEINSNKENVNFENTNPFSDHNLYNGGNERRTPITEETTDTSKQIIVKSSQNTHTPKQQTDASRQKTDTTIQKTNTPIQKTNTLKRKTCTPTKQAGNNKTLIQKKDNVDLVRTVRSESSTPQGSTRRELHYSKITTIEIGGDQQDTPEDRGDYIKRPPHIRIRPQHVPGSAISNPIENLNSNDWIIETSSEFNNDSREKTSWPKEHGDGVGNVIFMKHMSLFKPAEWEAYLPISESVPSLSLSVNTHSETNSRSWLKRFQKIFSCCK